MEWKSRPHVLRWVCRPAMDDGASAVSLPRGLVTTGLRPPNPNGVNGSLPPLGPPASGGSAGRGV